MCSLSPVWPRIERNISQKRRIETKGAWAESFGNGQVFQKLTTLRLDCTHLPGLPAEFWSQVPQLQTLDLSPNALSKDLVAGKYTEAANAQLQALPDGLASLYGMQEATCLSCLRVLVLKGCTSLRELPPGMEYLRVLETLNLTNCKSLVDLPIGLCSAFADSSLKTLIMKGCTGIGTKEFSNMRTTTRLESLTSLDLSYCDNMKAMPGLQNFSVLEHLNIR